MKKKTRLLATAIAMIGLAYLPQSEASVTNLGTIGPQDSVGVASGSLSKGSFQDWFDFQVSDLASLIASGNSVTFSANSKGTQLTSFNLYEGDHTTLLSTGTITPISLTNATAYSSLLSYDLLLKNHVYSIEVDGVAKSAGSNYSFSLSTAPVPVPSAAWLMLSGIGVLGHQLTRKQKA